MARQHKTFNVINHPLVHHKLTYMRQDVEKCPSRLFVQLMQEIGVVMACEVTREVATKPKLVDTIHGDGGYVEDGGKLKVPGKVYRNKKPVLLPVLRSGLVLSEGIRSVIPTTYTGHIGITYPRSPLGEDEEPSAYLVSLPNSNDERQIYVIDPVIASGKTACLAVDILNECGFADEDISIITLIVGTTGKRRILRMHPRITVHTAILDEEVRNNDLYPGLGVISDRLFRTN